MFTPAEADRGGINLINDEDQDVALLHQERTWRAWLTTCGNFLVNIPLP